jgi:hypothetical protein
VTSSPKATTRIVRKLSCGTLSWSKKVNIGRLLGYVMWPGVEPPEEGHG